MRIRDLPRAVGAAALALTVMTTATGCSDQQEKDAPGDVDKDEKDGEEGGGGGY